MRHQLQGNNSSGKAVQTIRRIEARLQAYRIYRNISRQHTQAQSFSSVQVPASWPTSTNFNPSASVLENPKTATDWRQVTIPQEIQFLMQLRNRLHFGQAHHDRTPFTIPPLSCELNWSASTGTADLILEGNYSNPDLETITTCF